MVSVPVMSLSDTLPAPSLLTFSSLLVKSLGLNCSRLGDKSLSFPPTLQSQGVGSLWSFLCVPEQDTYTMKSTQELGVASGGGLCPHFLLQLVSKQDQGTPTRCTGALWSFEPVVPGSA